MKMEFLDQYCVVDIDYLFGDDEVWFGYLLKYVGEDMLDGSDVVYFVEWVFEVGVVIIEFGDVGDVFW